MVVETMMEGKLSYREPARRFEINDHKRIVAWERIYLTEGAEGLAVERRSRRRGRETEGQRSAKMGGLDEHLQDAGGGNRFDRTDMHLNTHESGADVQRRPWFVSMVLLRLFGERAVHGGYDLSRRRWLTHFFIAALYRAILFRYI